MNEYAVIEPISGASSEPSKSPLILSFLIGAAEVTLPVKFVSTVNVGRAGESGSVKMISPSNAPASTFTLPMLAAVSVAPPRKASASNDLTAPSISVPMLAYAPLLMSMLPQLACVSAPT